MPVKSKSVLIELKRPLSNMAELPMGGTAVGTGINTHPKFAAKFAAEVSRAYRGIIS